MGLAFAVDPAAPTLARWLDHVEHAVGVMGIEHVGIGADFIKLERHGATAGPDWIDGFAAPADYPGVVSALRRRGFESAQIEAITSGNWLRVLRETLPSS
jgi:membrane dipeptidase